MTADGPERAARAIALTQGDPAGIGPEITLKAWMARREAGLPPFFVLTDPDLLLDAAERLGLDIAIVEASPRTAPTVFPDALPVVPCGGRVRAEPGRPDPATAATTIASIVEAVRLTRSGAAAALVTNPIAKHVLYAAGFGHPGHTEFLATLAAEPGGEPPRPVMMLWSEGLAVVPVTVHIALASVPAALTVDLILETARIVARDLATRFGIDRPRLALAGLNPHAGESGTMGLEDRDVVAPAVERLRSEGLDVSGPWPADTMFHARARRGYDAALCMYHDQALVPIKTIAFDEGVNVTLGLPFIRTSPDHGTAFDIAGRGIARADSLIAAIRLAGRLAARAAAPRVRPADGLPPLREVVAEHGLAPRRTLGQNFLFDLNLTARIARAAGPLEGRTVLEVGPGPGGLTRALLAEGAERVVAVERDQRCLPALAAISERWPGRLDVVEGDALELDPATLLGAGPSRIVSNLPYNVGTALLTRWLTAEAWPPPWSSATLMFQREVADRIVAGPDRPSDYGRLGVLCGWRTRARALFEVPPEAFVPPPKVTSAVVLLEPRPAPLPCPVRALEAVTRAAFGQRRKMLRQSLKGLGRDPAELIAGAGLDGTMRAEEVPVEGFVALARLAAAPVGH